MQFLIIEDDDHLRSEIMEYLQRRDHVAIACCSVAEAYQTLDRMGQDTAGLDAVVCDIRLSDGNGVDFYMANAMRVPKARWILMSGGYDHERMAAQTADLVGLPTYRLVNKPLSLRLLIKLAAET